MLKRIISAVLVLTLLFSLVPTAVFAEAERSQASVEDSELTVEGSNSFGALVSDAISENTEETETAAEDYPAGYEVTDLTIEGNVATVTYSSLEAAVLVVALYTEDGLQLIDSANTQVTADANEATVTFGDTMPEYFLAEAFLLDTYDHSPLCVSMETPMYTSDMQELLASTVADYDADRVFNLDEDETTNFAVFNDGVIVIDAVEGVNKVVSVDDENYIYVFDAVDEQIASLRAGDVVSYLYGEDEMLIFKVASLTLDGTTATVTGAELEIEEVFDYMKLESMGDSSQIAVDD
ncbi:MAG: hypothetical protein II290_09225, partial [Oscillospiraceae bacterium]|nr:hypothetical protein [Oscillospiraceae bacterium]